MKKVLLNIISFILTCSIIFTFFCVFAFAENNIQAEDKTFDFASNADLISYIEDLAASTAPSLGVLTKSKFTVSEVYTLNKFSSSNSYTLFLFEEGGHAVYDNLTETVEELCVEGNSLSDKLNSYGDYYYAGPGNFIVKQNENFYDLNTNIQLSPADVSAVSALETSVQNVRIAEKVITAKNARALVPEESTTNYFLDNVLYFYELESESQFGTNQNGTCTHIACAIMLGYYDYYVNDDLVQSMYHYVENNERAPGTIQAFHLFLQNFLGTSSCGLEAASSGLNFYIDIMNLSNDFSVEYLLNNYSNVFSTVVREINENRPAVIAMFESYGASMNHSVTVYGYRESISPYTGATRTYYVQTGWGEPLRSAYSHTWFADVLYIEEE